MLCVHSETRCALFDIILNLVELKTGCLLSLIYLGWTPQRAWEGLIIKMARCCWDGIFMGDYFHRPQTSPHFTKICDWVCACVYVCVMLGLSVRVKAVPDICDLCVCFCFISQCDCATVCVCVCASARLHPCVTSLSSHNVKSSTHGRRYFGQCETPRTGWDERQAAEWETDRKRNNEIDGSHEVMTAGRPH